MIGWIFRAKELAAKVQQQERRLEELLGFDVYIGSTPHPGFQWKMNVYMGVSKNRGGPPKSSILIGFSIINHPFWGTPIFGNTHMYI